MLFNLIYQAAKVMQVHTTVYLIVHVLKLINTLSTVYTLIYYLLLLYYYCLTFDLPAH